MLKPIQSDTSGKLLILTAPSGAGKTTIAHRLLAELPELCFSISATTRAPRPGEVPGRDYYFLSVAEFEHRISRGAFVEYEMVYEGKYYGTLEEELVRIWEKGRFPLRVVDVVGALTLQERFGKKAVSVFISPPSLEVLEKRLHARGTEDEASLRERVHKAQDEMTYLTRFDRVVVNDELEESVAQVAAIFRDFMRS
jgi:guanylate kinase